ncbi:MAG: precorrin-2 dehydrogenase [Candidatus Binatia bacterium]|nr:MAG: precorrin-2 dehydrogenase [Candidatus Binatia bacterium]
MAGHAIVLDLTDRACVVAGGGPEAARRVAALLEAGARVTVVAPALCPELAERASRGEVRHVPREFRPEDLDGAWLAYVTEAPEELLPEIAREASERRVFLNVFDRPEFGSFSSPAILRRGDLLLAASTGGKSPLLARKIRERWEREFGPEYAALLRLLGEIRARLRESGLDAARRKETLERLLEGPLLEALRAGDRQRVEEELRRAGAAPVP